MTDVLRRAARRSGCKVVGERSGTKHLLASVRWTRADVMLVGVRGGPLARPLEEALRRCPRLRLLALEGDGQGVFAYELHPKRFALGELSLSELLETLAATAPPRDDGSAHA
jgi:hypothetical protein